MSDEENKRAYELGKDAMHGERKKKLKEGASNPFTGAIQEKVGVAWFGTAGSDDDGRDSQVVNFKGRNKSNTDYIIVAEKSDNSKERVTLDAVPYINEVKPCQKMNLDNQADVKGENDMQIDSNTLPEFVFETGDDLSSTYTVSDYTLKKVYENDNIKPGISPKPADTAIDSPYRKYTLWVFQESEIGTLRCKVLLFLKTNNVKEEVKLFQEAFKEIIKETDRDYIESLKEEVTGLDKDVNIEERTYYCDIKTMDNKIEFGLEHRASTMLKVTLEEADNLKTKGSPECEAGVDDNIQQSHNEVFVDKKETLKKLIDDDMLFDAIIASKDVIIQQKIAKGDTLDDRHNFSTVAEMSVMKEDAIVQFNKQFAALTLKIIKDVAQDIHDEHIVAMREYKRKKRELKVLVDNCTEYIKWADYLVANKEAIMLKKRCEVLKNIAEELESKAREDNSST